jgi:hypothetical protein
LQARPFFDILIKQGALMYKNLFHFAILGTLLLSACGSVTNIPSRTSEPSELPALTGSWTITMNHSGGIMGLSRSVEVDSTGIYTVKDERTDQEFTGQLSKEELEDLINVVNATSYAPEKAPHGCADCFIYDIHMISDDGKFSAQVDDISIEESGLSDLVLYLRGIIERELT